MTKIFRSTFYRTKQAGPLEEEEEPLAAAGREYRDLEDGGGDETANPGSGGDARPRPEGALFVAVTVAYFVSFIGIYYLVLGNFYLPPEAGPVVGGRVIAVAGGVMLAVAVPVLAGGLAVCCCCRSARGRPSAVEC